MAVAALLGLVGPVGLVGPAPAPALGAASGVVAEWRMDEPAGSRVLVDASSHGVDGVVGAAVRTGVAGGTPLLHRWSDVRPNQPPATPERVTQVADGRLDPGTRDYAVVFRYRTTRPFGNILQKGQATTRGGQVKVQLPRGTESCLYTGALGRRAVRSAGAYHDGQWHRVRCERTAAGVALTVWDDPTGQDADLVLRERRTIRGATGLLDNAVPFTIGGKINCDQVEVTCDYFAGDIDWVRVEASA
ncbi:hypothetical protein D5H78_02650 [Vallicoccus soli]|uniref:Laminin G domain-containing protein n=1 Tax=Vallicoccus soli TaxID=2339232 RepID=A0A3A3Z7I9_9ACTN|nr:hypothetical protein D5H78_02650 [Vallicoccus soli]